MGATIQLFMKYPSLKNILSIVVAIVLVGGSFLFAEKRNKEVEKIVYKAEITPTEFSISKELKSIDTDEDGLKDWEEVIAGTNPNTPDTDKDGTLDGKEVELGRNPLVKGPNDKNTVSNTKATTNQDLTATDVLARDFFARYMELRQIGLSEDEVSRNEIINKTLQSGIKIPVAKVYTLKEIIVNPNSDSATMKIYENELDQILKSNSNHLRNEVVILKESIETENFDVLKEIDPIIASYKNIIKSLLKVRVPQNMTTEHLELLNSVSKMLLMSELIRKSDVDPLSGLEGATMYLPILKEFNTVFNKLNDKFNQQ